MRRFRVAVVEDDKTMAQQTIEYLQRFGEENRLEVEARWFDDGAKLVGDYHYEWDLILFDVEMPVMDGISAAKYVRSVDPNVQLMFITNLAQYAIRGYEVNALDYVLKPINYYSLAMKLRKALRLMHEDEDQALMLRRDGDVIRVPIGRIYYIDVYNHSLRYHTADGDIARTGSYTLSELEKELSPHGFVRCSQSYLVNLRYVDSMEGNALRLLGVSIPISRNKRKTTMEALLSYAKGKTF